MPVRMRIRPVHEPVQRRMQLAGFVRAGASPSRRVVYAVFVRVAGQVFLQEYAGADSKEGDHSWSLERRFANEGTGGDDINTRSGEDRWQQQSGGWT